MKTTAGTKLLNRHEVANYYGRSCSFVDKAVKSGLIPQPIRIGAPVWTLSMLEAHILKLESASTNS